MVLVEIGNTGDSLKISFPVFSFPVFRSPDFDEVVERLKVQGGFIVASDEYATTPQFKRLISDLPAPKLGLTCAGGRSATEIARIVG
jgi:hypothetical protein